MSKVKQRSSVTLSSNTLSLFPPIAINSLTCPLVNSSTRRKDTAEAISFVEYIFCKVCWDLRDASPNVSNGLQ